MMPRQEYRAWKAEIDLAETSPAIEAILTRLKQTLVMAEDDYEAAIIKDLINYCRGMHPWAREGLRERIGQMSGRSISTRSLLEMFGFEPPEPVPDIFDPATGLVRMSKSVGNYPAKKGGY